MISAGNEQRVRLLLITQAIYLFRSLDQLVAILEGGLYLLLWLLRARWSDEYSQSYSFI
jgi:hypothetical protein